MAKRTNATELRFISDPKARTNVAVNAFAEDGRDLRLVGSGLRRNRGWDWWGALASGAVELTLTHLELAVTASARRAERIPLRRLRPDRPATTTELRSGVSRPSRSSLSSRTGLTHSEGAEPDA